MDLGHFARRRWILWSWLLLPVILIALLVGSSHTYLLALEQDRAGLQSHYGIIPDLERSLRRAEETLAEFDTGQEITFEELTMRISDVAVASEWKVSSIEIEEVEKSSREQLTASRVIVIGEGSIASAMRYLDQIQTPRSLVEVETTQLTSKQGSAEALYVGRFVFVYYSLNSST